jgi:ABC-2 type transport system ATP-binding protein
MCDDSPHAALVADDVRKAYGDTVALDGVSVAVDAGEVFGLIGPNGAGKTTLVRALTGTTGVDGRVTVLGTDPTSVDRHRVGLLPQSFSPTERLSARELVASYAGLYDDARDVDDVLADVGLDDAGSTWYEKLSGGQRRRACVATALVNDPDVLFLDEPTTGIDPAGRRDLWTLVEGLAESGTTVFLTSHSMREVERLADRVGLLRGGRLVAVGTPEGLVADHGGTSRLVVTPSVTSRAVALDGFETTVVDGDLVVDDVGARQVTEAVAALDSAGVDYESLVWRQPSLEDVYLELTGERFEGERATEVTAR